MGKIIKKLNIIMLILVVIAIIKPISAKALDYWDIYKDSDGKYFKNEIATSLRNSGYLRYGKSSQVSLAWPRDVDGNGSDYNDYIPKYGGIWCLNEADNGSGKLSIQEILTIIGGGVYSDRYNISNNTDDTIDAAKFAYAIEYIDEYNNYPNYGHKGGFWTAFYNNWKSKNGKKLYANTAIQTIFGHGMYNAKTLGSSEKININGTQMTQSAYATSVSNLYKNLSCNSTAQMIEGQFKDTHKSTWDYKITGINLEWNWGNALVAKRQIQIGDTKYTVKYSDTYETWYIYNSNNSKVGRIVRTSNDAKGYIYLKKSVVGTANEFNIKFIETDTVLWARLYLLGANTRQTRGIARAYPYNITQTKTTKITKKLNPNVSMQKYIVNVSKSNPFSSAAPTKNYSGNITGRNNKIAGTAENTKNISKNITVTNTRWTKDENIVRGYQNYYVTYKIVVYNNNNNKGLTVQLNDKITDKVTLSSFYQKTSNGYANKKSKLTTVTEGDHKTYSYKFEASTSSDEFLITFKLDNITNGTFANKAWITSKVIDNGNTVNNEAKYRIKDYDYVTLEAYSACLQKYVSKVDNKTISGRENRQIWNTNSNYKVYKTNNPVLVEVGDTIEYTIKLTNNGKYNINVPKITDILPSGLTYKRVTGDITGVNVSGRTLTISVKSPAIAPGSERTIKVYAKVDNNVKINSKLTNKANITNNIIGKLNGNDIVDPYTIDNADEDYIKVIKPDVSMQKYIVTVTNSDGNKTYDDNGQYKRNSLQTYANEKSSYFKYNVAKNRAGKSGYKYDNPIEIGNGDIVTYKLVVYNNTEKEVTNIKVREKIPNYATIVNTKQNYITKQTDKDIYTTAAKWNKADDIYEYTISNIPGNSEKIVYISLKFSTSDSKKISSILTNTASISVENNLCTYRALDRDYVKFNYEGEDLIADVSMQKYVYEVQSGTQTTNYNNERRRAYAVSTEDISLIEGKSFANYNHLDCDIAKDISVEDKTNKLDSAVGIKVGDTVIYRICVYNNTEKTLRTTLTDRYLEDDGVKLESILIGSKVLTNNGSSKKETTEEGRPYTQIGEKVLNSEYALIDYDDDNYIHTRMYLTLKPGRTDVYVKLKYTKALSIKHFDEPIENKAYVYGIQDNDGKALVNNTNYRTLDADYVQVIDYKLNLEKHITKVTNGNNEERTYSRSGKPVYASYDANTNKFTIDDNIQTNNTYKKENVVDVNLGDTITYNITVNNNGKSKVKVDYIEDSLNQVFEVKSITASNKITASYSKIEDTSEVILINNGNGYTLEAGASFTISVTVKVKENLNLQSDTIIENNASIGRIQNTKNITIKDTTLNDNSDSDYIIIKVNYAVALEKYVSKIGNTDITTRENRQDYRPSSNITENTPNAEDYKIFENKYYTPISNEQRKYNNIFDVSNGDEVTYTIKVKNNGDNEVYFDIIEDILPKGVEYINNSYTAKKYNANLSEMSIKNSTKTIINSINLKDGKLIIKLNQNENTLLKQDEEIRITIKVKVTESNMSVNILKNTAEIKQISNKYKNVVTDSTPKDNIDSDYIQMKDVIISGTVWNDKGLNKEQTPNGIIDSEETLLSNQKVYLYRTEGGKDTLINDTRTDNGKYAFTSKNIGTSIKGPKNEYGSWTGTYYSYYVRFEYDGMTYTSTDFKGVATAEDTVKTSNAREDLIEYKNAEGVLKVKETREQFNNRFNTITSDGAYNANGTKTTDIRYNTTNKDGRIPSSDYIYDENTMTIQSSTNKIVLSDKPELETQLTHVNLGLKIRDVLDLEILSDVYKTEVTVNGQTGTYNYSNKVTVRKSDVSHTYIDKYEQRIRSTDIQHSLYSDTGLNIKVTYKVTVLNAAQTDAKVSKIIDYYDNRYTFVKAISEDNKVLQVSDGNSGSRYASKVITMPNKELHQGESTDIYIEFTLNNPTSTLKDLLNNDVLPTYNMVEILEYTSTDSDKYMKGLIDKDSAPGSANKEKARLVDGQSETTTVEYYFNATSLEKLKYEDDTYAAPVLYFVLGDDPGTRKLTGIVFADLNKDGKYNTGDKKIEGANVQLIEKVGSGAKALDNNSEVIYEVKTNNNGEFIINGFLPGEHLLKYSYGDNEATLIVKEGDKVIDSYNGYLYESTTPTVEVQNNKWHESANGNSVANDDSTRRGEVKNYTKTLNDEKTAILNSFYTKPYDEIKGTLGANTKMYANTANMLFDVEKGSANTFGTYTIDSMNFGIKQRPDTVITTAKSIEEITVVDSTGRNTLASLKYKNDGTIETKIGDILTTDVNSIVDISMEDDKLQGASMKIKYKVSTRQTNREAARINKFVDYIPNNLAFNLEIEDNKGNWQVVANKNDIKNYLANNRKSITDLYNVIVEATTDNKLTTGKDAVQTITLETKLSSTEATIEQIITSAEELIYEYKNTVEVLETHSEEAVVVKTIDLNGEIVLATLGGGISDPEHPGNPKTPEGAPDENDPTAPIITTSVDVAIHPPTGSEGLTISHFIIITSSLAVIGAGILLIKKYVLKK